jgi:hypothetical protein
MLHVLLDAWFGERAFAHPVTVLLLLGLWLFAFPAVVWISWGGFGQQLLEVGRKTLLTLVYIH